MSRINSFGKNSPLSTIRREQVNNDPLDGTSKNVPTVNNSAREDISISNASLPGADSVDALADDFMANCRTFPINLSDVSTDISGLRLLAKYYDWKNVTNISRILLVNNESLDKDQVKSIQILRFEGLFRMKMYDDLNSEVTAILGKEGSESFLIDLKNNFLTALKFLLMEVKLMSGRSQEAVEHLYLIKKQLEEDILNYPSDKLITFWLWKVKCFIINANVRLRNWTTAIFELKLIDKELQNLLGASEEEEFILLKAKIMNLSKLSRVLMQVGAIQASTQYYEIASNLFASHAELSKESSVENDLLFNQGLLLFCHDKYDAALDIFATIVETVGIEQQETSLSELEKINDLSKKSIEQLLTIAIANISLDYPGVMCAAAVNNFSICSLYLKKISTAVSRLEDLILDDPMKNMTDPIVFNLCTLYDLSYAPDVSTNKKKILQKVATKFRVDDPILHWKSFRL